MCVVGSTGIGVDVEREYLERTHWVSSSARRKRGRAIGKRMGDRRCCELVHVEGFSFLIRVDSLGAFRGVRREEY